MGGTPKTSLQEGLGLAYDWYLGNVAEPVTAE